MLCAAPLWYWDVPLRWFFLQSDDFVYLGWSRTAAALRSTSSRRTTGTSCRCSCWRLMCWLGGRVVGTATGRAELGVLRDNRAGHGSDRTRGRSGDRARGTRSGRHGGRGPDERTGPGVAVVRGRPGAGGRDDGRAHAGGASRLWRIRGGWWRLGGGLLACDGCSADLVGRVCRRPGRHRLPLGRRPPGLPARRSILAASRGDRWSCSSGGLRAGGSPRLAPRGPSPPRPPAGRRGGGALRPGGLRSPGPQQPGPRRPTTAGQALLFMRHIGWALGPVARRAGPAGSRRLARVNPLEAAGAILVLATFGMIFPPRDRDRLR